MHIWGPKSVCTTKKETEELSHGKTTKNQLHFLCEFFSQTLHNLVDLTFTIRLQQRRKGEPALEPSERRRKIIEIISIRRYDTMRNLACEFGVSGKQFFGICRFLRKNIRSLSQGEMAVVSHFLKDIM